MSGPPKKRRPNPEENEFILPLGARSRKWKLAPITYFSGVGRRGIRLQTVHIDDTCDNWLGNWSLMFSR